MFGIKGGFKELPAADVSDQSSMSELSENIWSRMAENSTDWSKQSGNIVEPAFLDFGQGLDGLLDNNQPNFDATPDGVEILDPKKQKMIEKGLRNHDLQMSETGDITRADREIALESSMPSESPVSSELRDDNSLESVRFFDTANNTRQTFSFGTDGQVESLLTETSSGDSKLINFDDNGNAIDGVGSIFVNRTSDGLISSFSLKAEDGSSNQTFTLDKSGNVLEINQTKAIMETIPGGEDQVSGIQTSKTTFADGSAVSTRTVTYDEEGRKITSEYDDGISNLKEFFNSDGEITESYYRSDRLGIATKNFEDRTERMTIRATGLTRTNVDFEDGRKIETILDPRKNESTITQTELDGSVFRSHETNSSITVKFTDAEGNWVRQATNKVSGITRQTRGNAEGEFSGVEEMRGA